MAKTNQDPRPLGAAHSWAKTPGTFLSGQAHVDGVDQLATTLERKWGAGRLRLLVAPELREKFDRQRYLFNQAIWHGDLEAVRRESSRMVAAWQALDKAADAAGAPELDPLVWETVMEDGTVLAIVRSFHGLRGVANAGDDKGRRVAIFTIEEIAKIVAHYQQVVEAKHVIPGATVEAVRCPGDPLDAIRDTDGGLDDPIDGGLKYGA